MKGHKRPYLRHKRVHNFYKLRGIFKKLNTQLENSFTEDLYKVSSM